MARSEERPGADRLPPPPPGWLFLDPAAVPERWRGRAITMAMVPLMRDEAAHILNGGSAAPGLEPVDEPLARLLARGTNTEDMAAILGMSMRTTQRRIAALRRKIGARSKTELERMLAARGYAS